ncbi:MAG TPA: glycerophosphodiester phosphodiesterase [Microlunatus sp.]|nr:glycerophosphodiester phosphodiesterase [Microlunatus sp.]
MAKVSRRVVLLGSAGLVGLAVGGATVATVLGDGAGSSPTEGTPQGADFEAWRTGQPPYFIGHRGVGDMAPEHTLPSYQMALAQGAEAVEVSVVMSADNVLYCHHDLTLDRTTTLRGAARGLSSTDLDKGRVTVPRLGPRWANGNMPAIPRLSAVLEAIGRRAVLCIEPKDDGAYPQLISEIESAGLKDSVMIKLDSTSPRLDMAHQSGYPVFAYLGNEEVATGPAVEALGSRLDPDRDALVIPAYSADGLFSGDVTRRAVETGASVWVFPLHRRWEADRFRRLGVEGFVTPTIGYLSGALPVLDRDAWDAGGLSAGELTRFPYSDRYALSWAGDGEIGLGPEAFVSLGQFCPIVADTYRISFDVAFDPLPADTSQVLSIAFGHTDDRYYEHRLGDSDGYHAILRADGSLGLYAHLEGEQNGRELTAGTQSPPMKDGLWSRLTLDVTPSVIRWSRDDGSAVEVEDERFRGGYIHLGQSSRDGELLVRDLTIG